MRIPSAIFCFEPCGKRSPMNVPKATRACPSWMTWAMSRACLYNGLQLADDAVKEI